MPAAGLHTEESEQQRIERWRAEMLERAGYSTDAAAALATRQDIDLHHAIGLIEKGCTPEVAVRILL